MAVLRLRTDGKRRIVETSLKPHVSIEIVHGLGAGTRVGRKSKRWTATINTYRHKSISLVSWCGKRNGKSSQDLAKNDPNACRANALSLCLCIPFANQGSMSSLLLRTQYQRAVLSRCNFVAWSVYQKRFLSMKAGSIDK